MENNLEVKEKKTTKEKVIFGLKIALNVVFYVLIIFLFLFSIMNIRGGNGTESFPNIFGRGFLSVQSDSMKRNDQLEIYSEWSKYEIGGFDVGDLVNVKTIDQDDINELKVGDVITYKWKIGTTPILNTHRIVYVHKDDSGNVDYVDTQGDKAAQINKYDEEWTALQKEMYIAKYNTNTASTTTAESVSSSLILGKVTSVNSGAGKVLDTIQKNWLFIFVIPIIILLVIEVFLVVRNIMILRGEKNKLELQATKEDIIADEKEKMRQELLAEMRAQGLIPQDEKTEEAKPVEETKTEETSEEKVEEVQTETTESVEEPQEVVAEEVKEENKEVTEEVSEEKVEEPEVEEAKEELAPEATESIDNNGQEESKEEVASVEENKEVTEEVKDKVDEPKEEEKPKKAPAKKSTTTAKKASTTKKTTTKKSTEKAE